VLHSSAICVGIVVNTFSLFIHNSKEETTHMSGFGFGSFAASQPLSRPWFDEYEVPTPPFRYQWDAAQTNTMIGALGSANIANGEEIVSITSNPNSAHPGATLYRDTTLPFAPIYTITGDGRPGIRTYGNSILGTRDIVEPLGILDTILCVVFTKHNSTEGITIAQRRTIDGTVEEPITTTPGSWYCTNRAIAMSDNYKKCQIYPWRASKDKLNVDTFSFFTATSAHLLYQLNESSNNVPLSVPNQHMTWDRMSANITSSEWPFSVGGLYEASNSNRQFSDITIHEICVVELDVKHNQTAIASQSGNINSYFRAKWWPRYR
jgi:hypothetical protein